MTQFDYVVHGWKGDDLLPVRKTKQDLPKTGGLKRRFHHPPRPRLIKNAMNAVNTHFSRKLKIKIKIKTWKRFLS
jgi:hypothetical protein